MAKFYGCDGGYGSRRPNAISTRRWCLRNGSSVPSDLSQWTAGPGELADDDRDAAPPPHPDPSVNGLRNALADYAMKPSGGK